MKKKELKELQKIRAMAHAKFHDRLYKMVPKADIMLQVLDKAITKERKRFSEKDLERLEAIKESAILEGEVKVVDMDVVKELDKFIGDEITKAIEDGRMAHPDKDSYIKKLRQQYQRHERRNSKSSTGSDKSTKGSSN